MENDKITDAIIEFFKTHENPDDSDIHKLSDDLGIDTHEFEGRIYSILSSFLNKGKSQGKDISNGDDLLKAAIGIEMEHTDNPELAKKIVMDHVSELGWDYYRELPKMEERIKGKTASMDVIFSNKGVTMNIAESIKRIAKEIQAYGWSLGQMPRSFWIPKSATAKVEKLDKGADLGLEIYKYTYTDVPGKLYGMAFAGKGNKPIWHVQFSSPAALDRKVEETIDSYQKAKDYKDQKRQQRKEFKHDFKAGDILVSSWGYDQTNKSYYQVISITDKSIKIKEIGSKHVDESHVTPIPNAFTGKEMIKIPTGNSVRISSYEVASKWDGKPGYVTPFGMGH